MTKIKTYEIQSDEQVTFLLRFEIVEEKIDAISKFENNI